MPASAPSAVAPLAASGHAGPVVMPQKSRQKEATVRMALASTPQCRPYYSVADWVAMPGSYAVPFLGYTCFGTRTRSVERTYKSMLDLVCGASCEYIWSLDQREYPGAVCCLPVHWGRGVKLIGDSGTPSERSPESLLARLLPRTRKSLANVFAPDGTDAKACKTHSKLRALVADRSKTVDQIIKDHTLHHNGATIPDPEEKFPALTARLDHRTTFLSAALRYRPPLLESVAAKTSGEKGGTHPLQAAVRHATVSSLRDFVQKLGGRTWDNSLSQCPRDIPAAGERPINTNKDLSHSPRSATADLFKSDGVLQHPKDGGLLVVSIIDTISYMDTISQFSGFPMIIWASYYPDLAGTSLEGTFFADSATTYCEVIGKEQVSSVWRNQKHWNFGESDVVVLPTTDHSAYTVYRVVRYPQPDCLKQVVFMCPVTTVNLPFAVVNQLTIWTKGHPIDDTPYDVPLGRLGPATNVVLVPADPKRPHTRDILVGRCGTPQRPVVVFKYAHATDPGSSIVIPEYILDFLRVTHHTNPRGLTMQEMQKRITFHVGIEDVPRMTAFCEVLKCVSFQVVLPNIMYISPGVSTSPEEEEEDRRAKATPVAPPITSMKASFTIPNEAAMQAAIKYHFVDNTNDTVPSRDWISITKLCHDKFLHARSLEEGAPKHGSIQLATVEDVVAKRTRPAQRAVQVAAGMGGMPEGSDSHRLLLKQEIIHTKPDAAPKMPRVVQNPNNEVSINSCRLGQAITLMLAGAHWNDVGKSATDLGTAVAETVEQATRHFSVARSEHRKPPSMIAVDYKTADDKHSEFSNARLRLLISRYIVKEEQAEALKIYDNCFNLTLQTGISHPRTVNTKWKNSSGTGITTYLNSYVFATRALETIAIACIFFMMEQDGTLEHGEYVMGLDWKTEKPYPEISFVMFKTYLRKIQEDGRWHQDRFRTLFTAEQVKDSFLLLAYGWLGQFFGDDALNPGVPFVCDHTYACALKYCDRQDGFVREVDFVDPFADYPEYLSRIWIPEHGSYCKISRAVARLSASLGDDKDRFCLKLDGYNFTDGDAPIVGAYVCALATLFKHKLRPTEDRTYEELAALDKEVAEKIKLGNQHKSEGFSEHAFEFAAREFNVTAAQLREVDEKLRNAKSIEDIYDCHLEHPENGCYYPIKEFLGDFQSEFTRRIHKFTTEPTAPFLADEHFLPPTDHAVITHNPSSESSVSTDAALAAIRFAAPIAQPSADSGAGVFEPIPPPGEPPSAPPSPPGSRSTSPFSDSSLPDILPNAEELLLEFANFELTSPIEAMDVDDDTPEDIEMVDTIPVTVSGRQFALARIALLVARHTDLEILNDMLVNEQWMYIHFTQSVRDACFTMQLYVRERTPAMYQLEPPMCYNFACLLHDNLTNAACGVLQYMDNFVQHYPPRPDYWTEIRQDRGDVQIPHICGFGCPGFQGPQ